MPVNDIKCPKCGIIEVEHKVSEMSKIEGRWFAPCSCGGIGEVLCTLTMKNNDWFRPHWNRDICIDGAWVKSKTHLKELSLKHGCINHALGDVRNITEI